MKKVFFSIVSAMLIGMPLQAKNIGVPAECEDVMLQAFYWDSYTSTKYGRTKWIDLLKDTAIINENFDLVWFPPSGGPTGGGVGYSSKQYSSQDSDWGTKKKLNELIAALHAGNTRVLADIVINHRGNSNSWCTFFSDNFERYGTYQLTQKHICRGDEGFTDKSSSCYNAATSERGADDTGSNFDGARDLDHTSEYVQNWAKGYTQWILDVMNYDGFRYDMTLGFHGRYLSMYNEASRPYLSVSELWDGIDRQKQHLAETDSNTMIFDFPQKYQLAEAIVKGSYGKLRKNTNSLRGQNLERYAVTFIDNHDTFEREGYGDNQFAGQYCDLSKAGIKDKVMQAHAYILMMPGVPCVFWPHWKRYQSDINELIAVRKRVGIHSESVVSDETTSQYNYSATILGHRGKVVLRLGSKRSKEVPEGYELAVEGGDRGAYTVFVCMNPQGIETVTGDGLRGIGDKFIENGKLYIRVGESIYDVLGNRVD